MMAVLNIKNKYFCETQKAGWCGGGVNDHHMCSVQEAVVLFSAFFPFTWYLVRYRVRSRLGSNMPIQ